MTAMPPSLWAGILAKMVAPMESELAAAAIRSMLAMLTLPDEVFTAASAREVCATGRVFEPGVFGPLTRVPTFGELEGALGRYWRRQREMQALRAAPMPRERLAGPSSATSPEQAGQAIVEAQAQVSRLVKAFVAERTFNRTQPSRETAGVKPSHSSDAHLLIECERLAGQGSAAAAMRAGMLRKKLNRMASVEALEPALREAAE